MNVIYFNIKGTLGWIAVIIEVYELLYMES